MKLVKKMSVMLILCSLGFTNVAWAAPDPATEEAKRLSKINVYENNQFGMLVRGVWYWLSKDNYLVAIDTGSAAYNLKDIASLELVTGSKTSDMLVIRLRSGETVRTPIRAANWVACRDARTSQTACANGGRRTAMHYVDWKNDLDLVLSRVEETGLHNIDIHRNAILNDAGARPILPVLGGSFDVFVDQELRAFSQRIDDYKTRMAAAKVKAQEDEKEALARYAREAPEREARYRRELQQEQEYWQAAASGSKMFCETVHGVGVNPGLIAVSLHKRDTLQCKGHEGKEVRIEMLEQAGWRIFEQGSRPSGLSEFLVIAQVIMQKVR